MSGLMIMGLLLFAFHLFWRLSSGTFSSIQSMH